MNPSGPLREPLFNGAKTTSGTSQPVLFDQWTLPTVYVTGYGTISTGTLLIEEADYDVGAENPFGGTWSLVETIDLTAVTGGSTTGIQQATHVPTTAPGFYCWGILRARFSVAITGSGGAVTIVLRGR